MIMAATSPAEGPKDTFRETVKVVAADLQAGVTLDRYVEGSCAAWKSIWKIRESSKTTLAGERARRLVIDQTIGPATSRLLKVFVAHAGKIYIVTCATEPAKFKAYAPRFDAVVASLAFVPVVADTAPRTLRIDEGELTYGMPYKPVMSGAISRSIGDHRATLLATAEPGTIALVVEAERTRHHGGKRGRVVADTVVTLAGRTAHKLVVVDGEGPDGDTTVSYYQEAGGRVATVAMRVDTAEALPAGLEAELEAMAASWKWN
jgi:hypothetical protein